jgi:uncharacterized membrane protein
MSFSLEIIEHEQVNTFFQQVSCQWWFNLFYLEIRLPEAVAKKPDEKETNVVAVVLPLTVILALVAIILALISWRIRRKKQLVLNAIEAHESAISPSTSNTNLYEHCPPR